LSPEEKIQFSFYCDEIFFCAVATHLSSTKSGAAHDNSVDIDYLKMLFEIVPGTISEWNRVHTMLTKASPKLTKAVDEHLASIQSAAEAP
jgi:hypothetical protein